MLNNPILLIGGTGKVGKRVASQLDAMEVPYKTATRHPKTKNDVVFDWLSPDIAHKAFMGIHSVYIVGPTNTSDHENIVNPILSRAIESGVKRFVLLSASSLERGDSMMGKIHDFLYHHAEEWCVVRPAWFMQNFSEQNHLQTIKNEGKIYSATNEGRIAFIDANDIARVVATSLLSDKLPNKDFILTGPNAVSYSTVAKKLTSILNYSVEHVNLSVEELSQRHQKMMGLDKQYADTLASMDIPISQGAEDRVTNCVLDITGQPPISIDEFIHRERDAWKR